MWREEDKATALEAAALGLHSYETDDDASLDQIFQDGNDSGEGDSDSSSLFGYDFAAHQVYPSHTAAAPVATEATEATAAITPPRLAAHDCRHLPLRQVPAAAPAAPRVDKNHQSQEESFPVDEVQSQRTPLSSSRDDDGGGGYGDDDDQGDEPSIFGRHWKNLNPAIHSPHEYYDVYASSRRRRLYLFGATGVAVLVVLVFVVVLPSVLVRKNNNNNNGRQQPFSPVAPPIIDPKDQTNETDIFVNKETAAPTIPPPPTTPQPPTGVPTIRPQAQPTAVPTLLPTNAPTTTTTTTTAKPSTMTTPSPTATPSTLAPTRTPTTAARAQEQVFVQRLERRVGSALVAQSPDAFAAAASWWYRDGRTVSTTAARTAAARHGRRRRLVTTDAVTTNSSNTTNTTLTNNSTVDDSDDVDDENDDDDYDDYGNDNIQRFVLAWLWFHSTQNGNATWLSCNYMDSEDDSDNVDNNCTFLQFSHAIHIETDNDDENDDRSAILCMTGVPAVRWLSSSKTSTNVSISECDWPGVTCNDLGEVIQIELVAVGMSGNLPSFLLLLEHLQVIRLPYGAMTGPLLLWPNKTDDGDDANLNHNKLAQLDELDVMANLLTGLSPESLKDENNSITVNLRVLNLSYNRFLQNSSSSLPEELDQVRTLQYLWLDHNYYRSDSNTNTTMPATTLPASWGNLTNLRALSLSSNDIQGTIPAEWSNLTSIRNLRLDDNSLVGSPPDMDDWSFLQFLYLNSNKLNGTFPEEFL